MLGHAASVSKQRMDKRVARNKKKDMPAEDPQVFNGKRLDELSTAEYISYYGKSESD